MTRVTAIVPATDRPSTLTICTQAIGAATSPPEEVIAVEEPPEASAAAARNAGARRASGAILVFIDADVAVHRDAFSRIRARFEADPSLAAVFGSYDDAPSAPGVVSNFRNLLHHHVHQESAGAASTFWTGLGAIRREAFEVVGGFDDVRFPQPSVEDIDLGMRLVARGARIELDPSIQGTHLKAWTLWSMLRTDFLKRGVPWVVLLLRHRGSTNRLNLGWKQRLSAASCVLACGALASRRYGVAAVAATAFVVMNRSFYVLLLRKGGPREAFLGIGLHALNHLAGVASVPAGSLAFLLDRRSRTA